MSGAPAPAGEPAGSAGAEAPVGGPPVLVCGAGPVGLSTALLLARWGVPSVVLERQARRDAVGSKAICQQRDVLDIFDRLGIAEAMVAEGVTWTLGRTYYREHELFTTRFPDRGRSPWPPWINISQASTEARLLEAAAASDLVRLRWSHEVTALRQDGAGVQVDVVTPDGPVTVSGSHLVAADGSRSAVRRLLGVDFPGRSFADQFLICDIRAELPFASERHFHFDPPWNPGRQVLVHHTPGGVWRIDWQVGPDYDLAAERDGGALDTRIRRIVGDRDYEIVWVSAYQFHERVADAFRVGRCFLAGDAAHLFAPFGARGLNSGMQDGENLAWKLAFVHRGLAGGAAGERLLDSYQQERRAAALENLRVTEATMRFLVPQTDDDAARRRDVLRLAVSDEAAHHAVDSGRLAEPYWYRDSPLTTPAAEPPGGFPTAAGADRPPVPGVICPDGPCRIAERPGVTRLRAAFGDGFVVLTAAADRLPAARAAAAGLGVPVTVLALPAVDHEGVLAPALEAGPDTVHVVRPDGHLAAVLPAFDPATLTAALRRACGQPAGGPVTAPASRAGAAAPPPAPAHGLR